MLLKNYISLTAGVVMLSVAGCIPEPARDSSELKSASDVKISVGESQPEPEVEEATSTSTESSDSSGPASATETSVASSAGAGSKPANMPATETQPGEPAASEVATPASSYTGPPKFFGRITVSGKVPELADLLAKGGATKDAVCAEEAVPDQSIVVSSDGGLANVFVYMKKAPRSNVPEPTGESPLIDQIGCVFIPHAAVVRVGQSVTMKNSDPVAHNVNVKAFQEAYNNVVPANGSTEHTFRFAERVPASTGCDFHTFMSAWILPVDHPWATVTDENGEFEIANLPEGKWDFVIWHERVGYIERSVEVTAAQNAAVEKSFEVAASKLSQ